MRAYPVFHATCSSEVTSVRSRILDGDSAIRQFLTPRQAGIKHASLTRSEQGCELLFLSS